MAFDLSWIPLEYLLAIFFIVIIIIISVFETWAESKWDLEVLYKKVTNYVAEKLISGIRRFIKSFNIFYGGIIFVMALSGAYVGENIDPEYIGIMVSSSTFLLGLFFSKTRSDSEQQSMFKLSYIIALLVFCLTIIFLCMSVLSDVAGNKIIFLYATLSVLLNIELYFNYYFEDQF